jgi:hypothetical protein
VAAVEAEGEFIEVVVQMLRAHGSLRRPQQPAIQQRRHEVHTGHQFVGWFVALAEEGNLVGVVLLRDVVISPPSVRVNHRPRDDRFFDEGVETVGRDVGHPS